MSAQIIDFKKYYEKRKRMTEVLEIQEKDILKFMTRKSYQEYLKKNLSEEDFLDFLDAKDNEKFYENSEEDIMDFVDTYFNISR